VDELDEHVPCDEFEIVLTAVKDTLQEFYFVNPYLSLERKSTG
jgi:hypothetical protein